MCIRDRASSYLFSCLPRHSSMSLRKSRQYKSPVNVLSRVQATYFSTTGRQMRAAFCFISSASFACGLAARPSPPRFSLALFLSTNFPAPESSIAYQPCLLYTSPSPRDRTRSRMPSSA
eukprot:TRINITY_DN6559_c0_g1_i3.p1 TRINITY_DN6559_c0_g1~~TRINITY_DN6559_c0_g1_i3.p1  ORF type:complete len:119 (+),score=14.23 TRINITY_DN6559_c0_g1_i3:136-492(+)